MSPLLFFSVAILFSLLYLVIGYVTSRSVKTLDSYFLAGRGLSVSLIIAGLVATQIGGGLILGTSDSAYHYGFAGLTYVGSIIAGFSVLGMGAASRLRSFNVTTMAQLFETHYGSCLLRRLASVFSIISLTGIFAAQVTGSRKLLLALDIYRLDLFLFLWVLIMAYALLGGLHAVVRNDLIQLALIVIILGGLYFYDGFTTGFSGFVTEHVDFTLPDWRYFISVGLMPTLYCLIEQDLVQIFFAARSGGVARAAAWLSALFIACFAVVPFYFGLKSRTMNMGHDIGGSTFLTLIASQYSQLVVLLVAYSIFVALISTANGVLCAISSNVVHDFEFDRVPRHYQLALSRVVMLIAGGIGIILGMTMGDIINVLVDSYGVIVSTLFVPLLVVYLRPLNRDLSATAALVAIVFGGLSYATMAYTGSAFLSPHVDGLIASALGYLLGLALGRAISD